MVIAGNARYQCYYLLRTYYQDTTLNVARSLRSLSSARWVLGYGLRASIVSHNVRVVSVSTHNGFLWCETPCGGIPPQKPLRSVFLVDPLRLRLRGLPRKPLSCATHCPSPFIMNALYANSSPTRHVARSLRSLSSARWVLVDVGYGARAFGRSYNALRPYAMPVAALLSIIDAIMGCP